MDQFSLGAIFLGIMVVLSCKIVINLPMTYEKLYCKGNINLMSLSYPCLNGAIIFVQDWRMITRCPGSQLLKPKSESCCATSRENLCGTPRFSTPPLKLGCRPPAGRASPRGAATPPIRRRMFYHHPGIQKGIGILKSCLRLRLGLFSLDFFCNKATLYFNLSAI